MFYKGPRLGGVFCCPPAIAFPIIMFFCNALLRHLRAGENFEYNPFMAIEVINEGMTAHPDRIITPERSERPHILGASYYPTGPILDNETLASWNVVTKEGSKPLTAENFLSTTGIEKRYQTAPHETPLYMAEQVAEQLLEQGEAPDVVLVSTSFPTGENIAEELSKKYGIGRLLYGDVLAGCSGYARGWAFLAQFRDFFEGRRVMTIGTEDYGPYLEELAGNKNIQDKSLGKTLFSAGAHGQAFTVGQDVRFLGAKSFTLPKEDSQFLRMPVDPSKMIPPYIAEYIPRSDSILLQDGHAVYEEVRKRMPGYTYQTIQSFPKEPDGAKLTSKDFRLVIGHQPSLKVSRAMRDQTNKLLQEEGQATLEYFIDSRGGNFSSGSIPRAIDAAIDEGLVSSGDKLLIPGFGVGFRADIVGVQVF